MVKTIRIMTEKDKRLIEDARHLSWDMKGSIKMALMWLAKSHRSEADIEKAINALKEVKL